MVKNSKYLTKREHVSSGPSQDDLPSDDVLDSRVTLNLSRSILPSTLGRYNMKIQRMTQWLACRGKKVMDAKDFSRFLESAGKGNQPITNGNSAKAWRSAWNFMKDHATDPVPSNLHDENRLKRQIKGKLYNAGTGSGRSPDPIDSGRLRSMASLFVSWNEPMYALYSFLIFYGGFRMKDGADITKAAVRFDTDIGTIIVTNRIKSAKPENIDLGNKLKPFKEVNNLTSLLRSLCDKCTEPEDLIFPGLSDAHCNTLIKRAAAALRWGDGWYTITSLRHGASREASALLFGLPPTDEALEAMNQDNVSKKYGHTNLRSKLHYQKSNMTKNKVKKPTAKKAPPSNISVKRSRDPWALPPSGVPPSPTHVEKKKCKRQEGPTSASTIVSAETPPPPVVAPQTQSKLGLWKKGKI